MRGPAGSCSLRSERAPCPGRWLRETAKLPRPLSGHGRGTWAPPPLTGRSAYPSFLTPSQMGTVLLTEESGGRRGGFPILCGRFKPPGTAAGIWRVLGGTQRCAVRHLARLACGGWRDGRNHLSMARIELGLKTSPRAVRRVLPALRAAALPAQGDRFHGLPLGGSWQNSRGSDNASGLLSRRRFCGPTTRELARANRSEFLRV